MAYQGHVSHSSFKHVGEAEDLAAALVAPADYFVDPQVPAEGEPGRAAHEAGYPRADGQPASADHFGG